MPAIQLSIDANKEAASSYGHDIMAVMIFPGEHEEKERRHWLVASRAHTYQQIRAMGLPWEGFYLLEEFREALGDIYELPLSPQRIHEDGLQRIKRASLSAHVLEYLLTLARHHQAYYGVERAKALVQESYGEGDYPSISLLDKVWASFKTVSPLWLAVMGQEQTERLSFRRDSELILSRAEAYRKEAEALRILPVGQAWSAPEGLALPAAVIDIPPLRDDLLKFLKEQFPA